MLDQLIIGEIGSLDFDASVKERSVGFPAKKSIKETVPFSNITYDFSAINGEVYWEERVLEYVFEIIAVSAEELEEKKQPFISWLMNVTEQPIHDPYIKDYHFVGTFSDISCDDSEFEKSTITAKFTAYPYMIANNAKVYSYVLAAGDEITVNIQNNSSHRITPKFVNDVPVSVTLRDVTFSFGSGETTNEVVKLSKGANVMKIKATGSGGVVEIVFTEEVL